MVGLEASIFLFFTATYFPRYLRKTGVEALLSHFSSRCLVRASRSSSGEIVSLKRRLRGVKFLNSYY